jgi:hypothetical protein
MTAERTPHETKSVDLELVENPPRRGRPLSLTTRVFLAVCLHVEAGFSVPNGCSMEGISYRSFRRRCSQNLRLKQRLKEAEDVRADLRREQCLEAIMRAGERGNWAAYAWILERSWPGLFALRSVSRVDPEHDEPEPELPAETLARHRQLYLEMLQEDQAKQALQNSVPQAQFAGLRN